MTNFIPAYGKENNIKNSNIINGSFYLSNDSNKIYADIDYERVCFEDVIFLNNESERTSILKPQKKLYIVTSTNSLWIYTTEWVQLNVSGGGSTGGSADITEYLGNCITNAPNGVLSVSGKVITFKSGLSGKSPNGNSNKGKNAYRDFTLDTDFSYTLPSDIAKGTYILFLREEYNFFEKPYNLSGFINLKSKTFFNSLSPFEYEPQSVVYDNSYNFWLQIYDGGEGNLDGIPIAQFIWNGNSVYDVMLFYPNTLANLTSLFGVQPLLVAGEGLSIKNNVISSSLNENFLYNKINYGIIECPINCIQFSGNTITVKSGLRVLHPDGFNSDGTYKVSDEKVTKDIPLVYDYTGSATTDIKGFIFLINNNQLVRVQADYYYEQATKPPITSGYISIWFNISEHKFYYATGSATEWTNYKMSPVGTFVYNRGSKVFTSFVAFEVTRLITNSEYNKLQVQIDELKAKIK